MGFGNFVPKIKRKNRNEERTTRKKISCGKNLGGWIFAICYGDEVYIFYIWRFLETG